MSPAARIALTFLLTVLAVLLWGASQLPTWYDRSYIGEVERTLAVFLFAVALGLNLLQRRPEPQRHPHPPPNPPPRHPPHPPKRH